MKAYPAGWGAAIAAMFAPVRCTCGTVYDMGKVEVTGRYLDCTLWRAPCCGRQVDDRGETGWKTTQDYHRLSREEIEAYGHSYRPLDFYGRPENVRWV